MIELTCVGSTIPTYCSEFQFCDNRRLYQYHQKIVVFNLWSFRAVDLPPHTHTRPNALREDQLVVPDAVAGQIVFMPVVQCSFHFISLDYNGIEFVFMSWAYSNTRLHQYHLGRRRAIQVRTADKFHILDVCHRVPVVVPPSVPADDSNYFKTHTLPHRSRRSSRIVMCVRMLHHHTYHNLI